MRSNQAISCPYCGETIPKNAAACPHCGSDERTGWSERTYLDGIDTGDDLDYEELRQIEFSNTIRKRPSLGIIVTGIVLLLIFILAMVHALM